MASNEERREVAARLRELYPDRVLPPFAQMRKDLREAVGCGWRQEHQDQKLHDRLADLIEPEPERTITLKGSGRCPDCNKLVGEGERYCAWCGAKVVEND